MKSFVWVGVIVLFLSGLLGSVGIWDENSWWVLVPAVGFGATAAAFVGIWIIAPGGRWSVRSPHVRDSEVSGKVRRRLAFAIALCISTLGILVAVRGILGQWAASIIVGCVLLAIGGAILEALHRSSLARAVGMSAGNGV